MSFQLIDLDTSHAVEDDGKDSRRRSGKRGRKDLIYYIIL
jgi:hypothetical protein